MELGSDGRTPDSISSKVLAIELGKAVTTLISSHSHRHDSIFFYSLHPLTSHGKFFYVYIFRLRCHFSEVDEILWIFFVTTLPIECYFFIYSF